MNWWKIAAAGIAGGLVATAATSLFQAAAAPAFGQDGGEDEPSNVKAAEGAAALVGEPLPPAAKEPAGSLVHYATGAALGLGYAALAARWRPAAAGFGLPYGAAVALALDDLVVPAFGWGEWPWRTEAKTHAYSLSTHLVFGAVLEGSRRLALAALEEPAWSVPAAR